MKTKSAPASRRRSGAGNGTAEPFDLGDAPGHLLRRCQQRAVDIFMKEIKPVRLTPRQFAVLAAVAERPGLTQTALVAATGIDRSTLGDMIDRLVRRGLLRRRRIGRANALVMQPAGLTVLRNAHPAVARAQDRIIAPIPASLRRSFLDALRRMASATGALVAAAWLALVPTQAGAQTAAEIGLAQEFLALELAGWRLPDPVEECLTQLSLRQLEPMAYGSEDLIDQPELVDGPGPHYRVLRVEADGRDRLRRVVQFEWLLPGTGASQRIVRDSFVFSLRTPGGSRPIMQREPEHMIIRRECFGG